MWRDACRQADASNRQARWLSRAPWPAPQTIRIPLRDRCYPVRDKVYLGTIDDRLIALDAGTGKPVWDISTIERGKRYAITGAPRVVKGLVLIGQGGAEFSERGYISAYDAQTGKMAWRWYTVPGNPAGPFENPQMEMAAKTWGGNWWKAGGGGTPWDAITYDPKTDLLFVGTGNGGDPGRRRCAIRAVRAITCFFPRSWRSSQKRASMSGTTRRCSATPGTTPPASRSPSLT
jgi:glucose dehydrogenase